MLDGRSLLDGCHDLIFHVGQPTMISSNEMILDSLVMTVLGHDRRFPNWRYTDCEIIPKYLAPYAQSDDAIRCVVRHVPSGSFLRYSKGPRQGHFWDVYGDCYQTPELALMALSEAPCIHQ